MDLTKSGSVHAHLFPPCPPADSLECPPLPLVAARLLPSGETQRMESQGSVTPPPLHPPGIDMAPRPMAAPPATPAPEPAAAVLPAASTAARRRCQSLGLGCGRVGTPGSPLARSWRGMEARRGWAHQQPRKLGARPPGWSTHLLPLPHLPWPPKPLVISTGTTA